MGLELVNKKKDFIFFSDKKNALTIFKKLVLNIKIYFVKRLTFYYTYKCTK